MRLERELVSARDAQQADAAEAATLRQQTAAELAALGSELARAKSELEATQAALETSTLELESVRHELQHQQPRRKTAEHFDNDRHLLFLPTAHGYQLLEQAGAAPEPGSRVEIAAPGGPATYVVVKTTASPRPASRMLCAYLVRRQARTARQAARLETARLWPALLAGKEESVRTPETSGRAFLAAHRALPGALSRSPAALACASRGSRGG